MKLSFKLTTLRSRVLVVVLTIELVVLGILVANSVRLQNDAINRQADCYARQIGPVLNATLTTPLAQHDLSTIQAVLEESHLTDDLLYLQVLDQEGHHVSSSGETPQDLLPLHPVGKLKLVHNKEMSRLDLSAPIYQTGQSLGTLYFGLDLTKVKSARNELLLQSSVIAVITLVLSILLVVASIFWLTRNLERLTSASFQVAAGNLIPTRLPESRDEIGQLTSAFNAMSLSIAERVSELAQQKRLLAATINSTNDLIFYKDLHGVYLGCNKAFADFVGRPVDKIAGATDHELLNYQTALLFSEQDKRMMRLNRTSINEEWITYPDGRCILIETKRSPLHGGNGAVLGLIGISRDITERKKLEDTLYEKTLQLEHEICERQKAQEKEFSKTTMLEELNHTLESRVQQELEKSRAKDAMLLQHDKMASIGMLAAGVAHEINNPVGFMLSNMVTLRRYTTALIDYYRFLDKLLKDNLPLQILETIDVEAARLDIKFILDDMSPLVAESLEGGERVKQIVSDLKDYARSDEDQFQAANLNLLIKSTINVVRNEIKYAAELKLDLGNIPHIYCIPQQINQVITNLLLNAAQAIVSLGVICVRTKYRQGWVVLEIKDTGKGMDNDQLGKIFDPFFTTKPVGKGTGLGLSICYDIIHKKHQGKIEVASKPDVGTTFTVYLRPVADPAYDLVDCSGKI